MIYRRVKINDWTIRFLFSFDKADRNRVIDSLFWSGAPDSIIESVEDNIEAERLNEIGRAHV